MNALVGRGADINKADNRGYTPLHLVIDRGNFETVICLLEEGPDVNKADRYERTPLNLAVQLINLKIVNALLGASNKKKILLNRKETISSLP